MSKLEISWTKIQGDKIPPDSILVEFKGKAKLFTFWNAHTYGIPRERNAFWRGVIYSCIAQAIIYLIVVLIDEVIK